jgi:hypothetical protein
MIGSLLSYIPPVALQSFKDLGRLTYRFLDLFRHMVGLLGRVISPSRGLYLHRTTQHRKTRTNIHVLSEIRIHDPSNQPAKTHDSDARPLWLALCYITIHSFVNKVSITENRHRYFFQMSFFIRFLQSYGIQKAEISCFTCIAWLLSVDIKEACVFVLAPSCESQKILFLACISIYVSRHAYCILSKLISPWKTPVYSNQSNCRLYPYDIINHEPQC